MATSLDHDRDARGRSEARPLSELAIKNLKAGQSRTDGALPAGNGRLVISCAKARGQLRRVWTFRYRTGSLRGELKIGEHPTLTLEHARNEARGLLEQVRIGTDPKVSRSEARLAKMESDRQVSSLGTFGTLLHVYVDGLRRSEKQSAKDVAAIFKRNVFIPWPDLMEVPANRIAPETIRDILAKMVRRGVGRQTNILRTYLQAAFTHGAHSDLDPRRAASDSAVFKLTGNPVTLVPRIKEFEATRDRILSDAEFRHLWNKLADARLEIGHTIRCQVLLGGQRFLQILRATWKDYDAQNQILRLADPKGKRMTAVAHRLPVSKRVALLLEELRSYNGEGEYIFSTTGGMKKLHHTNLSPVFKQIANSVPLDLRADEAPFQGRDVRRSVETRLQSLGVLREVRAQLLSHGRTTGVQQKHYERHDYLVEKADALEKLEVHLFSIFDTVPGGSEPEELSTSSMLVTAAYSAQTAG